MSANWTDQSKQWTGNYTITTGNWTDQTTYYTGWSPPLYITETHLDRCNPVDDESEGRYIAPSTSPLSTDNQIAALHQMIRDLTVAHADLLREVDALRDMIRAAPQPTVPAARATNTLDRSGYYR